MMDDCNQLGEEIRKIAAANQQMIDSILNLQKTDGKLTISSYAIRLVPDSKIFQFETKEIQENLPIREVVSRWKVPPGMSKICEVDPDKYLYGDQKEVMETKCETFEDLVRLNRQVEVGNKYLSLLREKIAFGFGLKFKQNLESVCELLELLLSTLKTNQSTKPMVDQKVATINHQLQSLFSSFQITKDYDDTFDQVWSLDYFQFPEPKEAVFNKASTVFGYSNYNSYPAVRIKGGVQNSISFRMLEYGWFGVGTKDLPPHGFPGYLPTGFMIRIDGGAVYSGKSGIPATLPSNLTGKVVKMTYSKQSHSLEIVSDSGTTTVPLGGFPVPDFYVFSMAKGKVELQ